MSEIESPHLLEPVRQAQHLSDKIAVGISEIYEAFEGHDATIGAKFKDAAELFRDAAGELGAPTIRLATFGTTSSGKSTLLNGIIGLQVMPMDVGEMSAGLVMFEHEDRPLVLEDAQTGEVLAEEDACYVHLQRAMKRVLESRDRGEAAPTESYRLQGRLFPLAEGHEFRNSLDGRVGLKVFDLPGLRTVNDQANAKVIRGHIRRSFCLVCIDRTQMFAHETREKLLSELKGLISDLGGRDDLLLFVFNKWDLSNPGGISPEDELDKAADSIAASLGLSDVALIPFAALDYLFATQLMRAVLGGDVERANSLRDQIIRNNRWDHIIAHHTASKPDKSDTEAWESWVASRRRFNAIREDVEVYDGPTETAELKFLALQAMAAAHHSLLWRRILDKLESNLATVIVYPAVSRAVMLVSQALREFDGFCRAQSIETQEALQRELDILEQARGWAKARIRGLTQDKKRACQDAFNGLNNLTEAQYQRNIQALGGGELPAIEGFLEVFSALTRELEELILDPIQMAFAKDWSSLKLTQALRRTDAEASLIEEVTERWERLLRAGYDSAQGHTGRLHKSMTADIRKHKAIRSARAKFYLAVRRLMVPVSQNFLRRRCVAVTENISTLSGALSVQVWEEMRGDFERQFSDSSLLRDTPASLMPDTQAEEIVIDASVFDIPEPGKLDREKKEEVVGTTREDPNASCFRGEQKDVMGEVEYILLSEPSAPVMIGEFKSGIRQAQEVFWDKLTGFLVEQLEDQLGQVEDHMDSYLDAIDRGLEARSEELTRSAEHKRSQWEEWSEHGKAIASQVSILKALAGYGGEHEG